MNKLKNKKHVFKNAQGRYSDLLLIIKKISNKRSLKILDYGCGLGELAYHLGKDGHNVVGIDPSNKALQAAKYLNKDQENVVINDSKKIKNYANKSFDLVTSVAVAEHVHNVGNYLNNVNRVLKKDKGQFLVALPNIITPRVIASKFAPSYSKYLKSLSKEVIKDYDKENDHINAWDASHFVRLNGTMGFKLEGYYPSEGVSMPQLRFIPKYLTSRFFRGENGINKSNKYGILKNFQYTMIFLFTKVKDVEIKIED